MAAAKRGLAPKSERCRSGQTAHVGNVMVTCVTPGFEPLPLRQFLDVAQLDQSTGLRSRGLHVRVVPSRPEQCLVNSAARVPACLAGSQGFKSPTGRQSLPEIAAFSYKEIPCSMQIRRSHDRPPVPDARNRCCVAGGHGDRHEGNETRTAPAPVRQTQEAPPRSLGARSSRRRSANWQGRPNSLPMLLLHVRKPAQMVEREIHPGASTR